MPPGYVHLNLWKKYLPYVLTFSVLVMGLLDVMMGPAIATGYLMGYFIDPDLDQLSMTEGEGRILKNFKIFGAIFLGVWLPYAYLFKHRGISHYPILGTLTRWGYLSTVFLLVLRPPMEKVLEGIITYPMAWLGIFCGMAIADTIHSGADFGWIKLTRSMWRKR